MARKLEEEEKNPIVIRKVNAWLSDSRGEDSPRQDKTVSALATTSSSSTQPSVWEYQNTYATLNLAMLSLIELNTFVNSDNTPGKRQGFIFFEISHCFLLLEVNIRDHLRERWIGVRGRFVSG